jgi:predicted DNA-binding protein
MKSESVVKCVRLTPEMSRRFEAVRSHINFSAAVRRAIERELPVIEEEARAEGVSVGTGELRAAAPR